MKVTVRYGVDSHDLESINAPTVGSIKTNATLKAILGFGDNVKAMVDGVEQPDGVLLPEGATVVLETKCNQKAS